MNVIERYGRSIMRVILRRPRLKHPKEPKLKIRQRLERLSVELEDDIQLLNDLLESEHAQKTTRDLATKLIQSVSIFRETELDKDMISRMRWFPQLLVDPNDFSVVLCNWLEDDIELLKITYSSLEET